MKLKVGDVVEFKKYEDMSDYESISVPKDKFPKFGKVASATTPIDGVTFFTIEGSTNLFKTASVVRVIIDADDVRYSNSSDEK